LSLGQAPGFSYGVPDSIEHSVYIHAITTKAREATANASSLSLNHATLLVREKK
jgi:hypothetical protein